MPAFAYTAVDSNGRDIRGQLVADDESMARSRLREMGYYPTSLREVSQESSVQKWWRERQKVRSYEMVIFSRQLAAMIGAGLPIVEALRTLEEETPNLRFQMILAQIREDILSGKSLYEAIGRHRDVFPEILTSLVRVGEVGGALHDVLEMTAGYLEEQQEQAQQVKSAFVYPVLVSAVALVVVVLLLVFAVPIFQRIFEQLGLTLPLPTRMLIWTSRAVMHYWWLILLIGAGVVAGYRRFARTELGHEIVDRVKLKIPVLGGLLKKAAVARCIRALSILVKGGVQVATALETARGVAANRVLEHALTRVEQSIVIGRSITRPLQETGIFPNIVVQMIRVGEATGNLDGMLEKAAEFCEQDVRHTTERLTVVLEPLMTVMLGVILAGVALSMYLPYFDLIGKFGK